MKVTRIAWLPMMIMVAWGMSVEERYDQAMKLLAGISIDNDKTIYNYENMDQRLYIPQYDITIQDYILEKLNEVNPIIMDEILPQLEINAQHDHIPSLLTLADVYLFGNYSIPTNYSKSLQYYHRIVEVEPNGHAYFMLGFIYSTGLFGEVEKNLAKSNLYYQFGVENDDINSMLALAYKNYQDIADISSCDSALFYYSSLAHKALKFHNLRNESNEIDDVSYNIRICDFNGGLFGEKLSETNSSILRRSRIYKNLGANFNDFNLDIDDHEYVHYYYQALKYYTGDYFLPKNYTLALSSFTDCAKMGTQMYGPSYSNINRIDRIFLSFCQARLGHMYLKGQGTEVNPKKAKIYLTNAIKLYENSPDAYHDLGTMYEDGLADENGTPDIVTAIKYYGEAVQRSSVDAKVSLSKLLTKTSPNQNPMKSEVAKNIYTQMKDAAYAGDIEAMYYFGDYIQSGFASFVDPQVQWQCKDVTYFYKSMIEYSERLFAPHLEFAFEQLIRGNFKNALLAYLIAAEQGFEGAQVSAANLLYQVDPLYSVNGPKTFERERVLAAIGYLEKSASQMNTDSAVFLGNLYANGVESCGIDRNYNKAFQFYQKAAHRKSSHAAYNLGQMYEYGLGPANTSIDYHMAKRYYDLSFEFKNEHDHFHGKSSNKLAINLAVLRLRMKYMFSKKSSQSSYGEHTGWLNAFRKIRSSKHTETDDIAQKGLSSDSLPGEESEQWDVEIQEYDTADYIVIFFTFSFFLIFFVQNIIRQIRRMRANNQNNHPPVENEGEEGVQQNQQEDEREEEPDVQRGWRFNQNGVEFRGMFNVQFFAL